MKKLRRNRKHFFDSPERQARIAAHKERIGKVVARIMERRAARERTSREAMLIEKMDRVDAMGMNPGWSS